MVYEDCESHNTLYIHYFPSSSLITGTCNLVPPLLLDLELVASRIWGGGDYDVIGWREARRAWGGPEGGRGDSKRDRV